MSWIKDLLKINKEIKNVHYLQSAEMPVEKIYKTALDARLETATIVGWTQDGKLFIASTQGKCGDVYWDLNLAAREMMNQ